MNIQQHLKAKMIEKAIKRTKKKLAQEACKCNKFGFCPDYPEKCSENCLTETDLQCQESKTHDLCIPTQCLKLLNRA